jgi:hypothetical protein
MMMEAVMDEHSEDPELKAIGSVISALENLDDEARQRVLLYVTERLSIAIPRPAFRRYSPAAGTGGDTIDDTSGIATIPSPADIRALKDAKAPQSAIEMAVLVAYYMTELAPIAERKSTVNAADLRIYFKQAKYPLPNAFNDILPNTKKAGYVETVTRGEYKLNSVGYNLAVHGLPHAKPT